MPNGPKDRPPSGGKCGGLDDPAGLLGVVDHRGDDAHRARVEQPPDQAEVVAAHAGHRHGRSEGDALEGVHRRRVVPGPVLRVDHDKVEPQAGHHLRGQRRAESGLPAERGLAFEHPRLGVIPRHAAALPTRSRASRGAGPSRRSARVSSRSARSTPSRSLRPRRAP